MTIGVLSSAVFFAILFKNISEYKVVESYTESFSGYVSMGVEDDGVDDSVVSENTSESTIEDSEGGNSFIIPDGLDYKGLEDRNSDFIGWMQSREISLPMVQTTDNSFYLTHNFDKQKNKYGSIFLDYRLNVDGSVLLFHGHNVSGDLMFGTLKKYANTKGYLEKNKKFAIALSSSEYEFKEYLVEDYIIVNEMDELLTPSDYSFEEYKNLLKKHIKNPSDGFKNSERVIVLSTCYGNAGTDKRLLLILV